jgi:hypothetical protein
MAMNIAGREKEFNRESAEGTDKGKRSKMRQI